MPQFTTKTIGNQTLILGNCLDVLPTLGKVDVIITDPPYNFSTSSSSQKHELLADATNSAYFFREVFKLGLDKLQGHGMIWQFCNWKTMISLQMAIWQCDHKFDSVVVWDKETMGTGGKVGLRPSYELITMTAVGKAAIADRGVVDIWRHKWGGNSKRGWHGAEKPFDLIEKILKKTAKPCKVVLDPFMGSGTTLVAAQNLGLSGIGIEIDPVHFEAACNRLEQAVAEGPRTLG